jgi:hypothetical protein
LFNNESDNLLSIHVDVDGFGVGVQAVVKKVLKETL